MAGIAVMKDNTRFYLWDDGVQVAANHKVGNITQIGDVGGEAEDIDTTTIESKAREYVNGFDDNGTIDLTQNVTENEYTTMAVLKDAGLEMNWGISSFDKTGKQVIGLRGRGTVKSARLTGISVGGLLQATSSVRVSGAIENDFVDPIGPNSGVKVANITVTGMGGENTISTKGGKLQMIATITPANADNKQVDWKVDQENLANISVTGELVAVADGSVKVTATAKDGSGVSGEMSVTITGQSED